MVETKHSAEDSIDVASVEIPIVKEIDYSMLAENALEMAVNSYLVMTNWDKDSPDYKMGWLLISFFEANKLKEIEGEYKKEVDNPYITIPIAVADEYISGYFDFESKILHDNYIEENEAGEQEYLVNSILGNEPPAYHIINVTPKNQELLIEYNIAFNEKYLPQYTGTLSLKIEGEEEFKYASNIIAVSQEASFVTSAPDGDLTDYVEDIHQIAVEGDFQGLLLAIDEPAEPVCSGLTITQDKLKTLWLHKRDGEFVVTQIPNALLFFQDNELCWSYYLHSVYTKAPEEIQIYNHYGAAEIISHYIESKNYFELVCNKAPNDYGWNEI